ncbi:MAG TPA: HD domain-containing protein [Candidatus Paceibacterota bacterium]
MVSVKDILGQMKNPSVADEVLIRKAYAFAEKAHEGHTRYSGEPYFIHPTAVALQLAKMELDAPTIAAGLLHDVIEDTHTSEEEVEHEFGREVLFLVQGVTKLGTHKYRGAERHAESLRRLLVATSADVRVLIIKLVDRYHNMTTLAHVPELKRQRIALETVEIYAPIADRLGMGRLKSDLEDLAFPYIDPDAYQHTLELRKLKNKENENGLALVKKALQRELVRKGFTTFRTDIRVKGLWSLHQKLKRKHDDITEIHDIAALRVIVPTIDDCYHVLGVIHMLWKPLPGNFKDYISFPKPNGYQSLHTTVVTSEAGIVEIQIRTEEMHRRAQYGIASHMSYKTLGKDAPKNASESFSFSWIRSLVPTLLRFSKKEESPATEEMIDRRRKKHTAPEWLTDLADAHASIAGTEEFIAGLKEDFFSHRVFVFTPKGDVVDLPINSTPLDFAYAIHSDLGNHLQGAKVNGKLVAFDTELHNGDIVEAVTRPSARPSAKWLDYARTSLARRHIRAVLSAEATTHVAKKPIR